MSTLSGKTFKVALFDNDNTMMRTLEISAAARERLYFQLAQDPRIHETNIERARTNVGRILATNPGYAVEMGYGEIDWDDDTNIILHGAIMPDFPNAFEIARVDPWALDHIVAHSEFATAAWGNDPLPLEQARSFTNVAFQGVEFTRYDGIEDTIKRLKDAGILTVVLTDANADLGSFRIINGRAALNADLIITRSDSDYPHEEDGEINFVPSTSNYIEQGPPHLVVANCTSEPKKRADVFIALAGFLSQQTGQLIKPEDMLLVDDHLGVCGIAQQAGVTPLYARYGTPQGEDLERMWRISPSDPYFQVLVSKARAAAKQGAPDGIITVDSPLEVLDHVLAPESRIELLSNLDVVHQTPEQEGPIFS